MSDAVTTTPLGFSVSYRGEKGLKPKRKDLNSKAAKNFANAIGDTVSVRTAAGEKPKLEKSIEKAFKSLSKKQRHALQGHTSGKMLVHVTEGDAAIDETAKLFTLNKKGKVKKIKGENSRKAALKKNIFKKDFELKKRAHTMAYNAEASAERNEVRASLETIKNAGGKLAKHAKAAGQKLANGKGLKSIQDAVEKILKHLGKITPELSGAIKNAITKAV